MTTTTISTITIDSDTKAGGNVLEAGTYTISHPSDYDAATITGEDILMDDDITIVTESVEERLQVIADALNDADRSAADYNHWEHFDALCNEHGIGADYDRQDREDIECSYSLFAEEGSLHLSGGKWAVNADFEPVATGLHEDGDTVIGDAYAIVDETYPGSDEIAIVSLATFTSDAQASAWHAKTPHYGRLVVLDLAVGETPEVDDIVTVDDEGVAELV
jgi:hypothetical protein